MSTTESKYTPGPWEVTNLHDLCSPEVVGNGRNVAMVRQPFASGEEIAANARLIAAAPAMLEALKCAYSVIYLLSEEVNALGCRANEVLPKVKAAIALAEGESQ